MTLFIDSKVIGYVLAFAGTIVAACIKRDSDRKDKEIRKLARDLNESHSLQKDLTQKLENIQELSGVDVPDIVHEKIKEILGGLRDLGKIWSPHDSRAYASAYIWLDQNGHLLTDETWDLMKKDKRFLQYGRKNPGSFKHLKIGIGDYLSLLLVKLERRGRERVKLDESSIYECSYSIPFSYYRIAFELMETKVEKLSSQSRLMLIYSKYSPIAKEYSPITREDSRFITYFLQEFIRQVKELE